jgi:hypothetical protein
MHVLRESGKKMMVVTSSLVFEHVIAKSNRTISGHRESHGSF